MKIFSWVGDQFAHNLFNMLIYTTAVYFVGAFSATQIPGVNAAMYKIMPASLKEHDE